MPDMIKDSYGVLESNSLINSKAYWNEFEDAPEIDWTDSRLAKITRLRLLGDFGFPLWDVSYCHGRMKDGSPCHVRLPFDQLPRRGMKAEITRYAKKDKVYAKGLGILDDLNISKLL